MAMIKCPECNHEVSDKASSCPKCGFGLASIELRKTIKENKSIGCFTTVKEDIAVYLELKKKLYSAGFLTMVKMTLLMMTIVLVPFLFYKEHRDEKKLKKMSKDINQCMQKVFLNVSHEEANLYFNSIESNVLFDSSSQDVLMTDIYIHATKLDADAILLGNMDSSTKTYVRSNDKGKVNTKSVTTHSNTVTFFKLKV